jgi:uncharacterized phage protein gp47/JayE
MSYYTSAEDLYNQMKINVTNVDTSENSLVYNSLFPSAMELSYSLLNLDEAEKKVFASSAVASGYSSYLEKRVAEMGIYRKTATYAKILVTFTGKSGTIITKGSVVSTNDNRLYTTLSDVTIGDNGLITCYVISDKTGSTYNVKAGDICYLPIKYNGITSVTNTDNYTEAYDDETDEDLYARYLLKVQTPATSGNIYQYQQWCLSVTGVGAVKVYPLKDSNFVTKNGHVTCVITDSNKRGASQDLINAVKNYIDPVDGTGNGQAPIGATVHIISVQEIPLNITVDVQIDTTTTLDTVRTTLINSITTYLKTITFNTKKVSLVKIGSLLLDISGVQDYSNLKINGLASNLSLSEIQVATMGTVALGVMS